MPVVVNAAHEAKPHLPGAVLMLLAVLSATNYVRTGRRRYWLGAGALCGAAFGMAPKGSRQHTRPAGRGASDHIFD